MAPNSCLLARRSSDAIAAEGAGSELHVWQHEAVHDFFSVRMALIFIRLLPIENCYRV